MIYIIAIELFELTDCPDGHGLELDMPLELAVEHEGDVVLARFARIQLRENI